jgi:hypothetical protein
MSDNFEVSPDKLKNEGPLLRVTTIAGLVRDIGIILGVPVVLSIGFKLYDLQTKALEDKINAANAQIEAVQAKNDVLKEAKYDRALALLN